MTTRIERIFAQAKNEGRAALVTYIMAGDPDYDTALALMKALPPAGSDVIELGLPFSDPMADGPTIQAAGLRALKAGQTLSKTLQMVADFRRSDQQTPVILMGYYNPIYHYGVNRFLGEAKQAGLDGLLIVDLPPEMDDELCLPALEAGLHFIRLATPTTDAKRLPKVLQNTSGFVYYVSMTGITGAALADSEPVGQAVYALKQQTNLPIAVGFGIKTAAQVAQMAGIADGVVVGSALIGALAATLDSEGQAQDDSVICVANLVRQLRAGLTKNI